MITIKKHEYQELEVILDAYIADPKRLQLGSGALPLLCREVQEYGFSIGNNLLIEYVDKVLSPYFADDMFLKVNNETFKAICSEIKEGIRSR